MPFVPHIVGDEDDDIEEMSEEMQVDQLSTTDMPEPIPIDLRMPNSSNSSTSSSGEEEDDESDTDDEDVESSSSDEEADWSMNVIHIARTPQREIIPEDYAAEVEISTNDDRPPIDSTDIQSVPVAPDAGLELSSNDSRAPFDIPDIQSVPVASNAKVELTSNDNRPPIDTPDIQTVPVSSVTASPVTNFRDSVEMDCPISSSSSKETVTNAANENEQELEEESSPPLPPRRQSLRKPNELTARHLCLSQADYSSPKTIGARVAKRGRRSAIKVKSNVSAQTEQPLARPLDVTAYFQQLGRKLVQQRVCMTVPQFLRLRERIDLLVNEAMVKKHQ